MFKDLESINFEALRELSFANQSYKTAFNDYFKISEKIYQLYMELKGFEDIFIENDKKIIDQDTKLFSEILGKIQNHKYKKPDERLRKDKFSNNYASWLSQNKARYQKFSEIIEQKENSHSMELLKIEESNQKTLSDKDASYQEILENIKNLEDAKKVELGTKNDEINTLSADKDFLEKREKELELELKKKELNKLAEAFKTEESKYSESGKGMIYFGFTLLLIPGLFLIYVIVSKAVDKKFFNILDNYNFDYYTVVPFLILTLILWYFQYFQLKNYYINRDLATNFSNRKAIANSFKGLLELVNEDGNNLGDKTELISRFIDKASNILYSEIDTSYIKKHENDVPTAKALDLAMELIKRIK